MELGSLRRKWPAERIVWSNRIGAGRTRRRPPQSQCHYWRFDRGSSPGGWAEFGASTHHDFSHGNTPCSTYRVMACKFSASENISRLAATARDLRSCNGTLMRLM